MDVRDLCMDQIFDSNSIDTGSFVELVSTVHGVMRLSNSADLW